MSSDAWGMRQMTEKTEDEVTFSEVPTRYGASSSTNVVAPKTPKTHPKGVGDCVYASMQTSSSLSLSSHPYADWLSAVPMGGHQGEPSAELQGRYAHRANSGIQIESKTTSHCQTGKTSNTHGRDAGGDRTSRQDADADDTKAWQEGRLKAKVLAHPLFPQLLAAHVGCLRTATPVDQLSQIDEQLGRSQQVIEKYSIFAPAEGQDMEDKEDLDDFMRNYIKILVNMQEQLQDHVRVHAAEAMVALWEIEQKLYDLTGAIPAPSTGSTMSDDDEDDSSGGGYESGLEVQDSIGFGPLVPNETERSLMERVRQDLKLELSEQGYREKIAEVREEILRKRRAGKLPEGTTPVLKAWWNAHSKWPYPTEDEKERLIQETGLELKQVNNWFINQRKRNWHNNPLSSSNDRKSRNKV